MHPKLAAIEENFHACGWAYVCSLCYSGQSLTDGHFPLRAVLRMADVDRQQVMALVEQGLWHLPDHDCPDCEQPKPGHAIIHDYLKHQRSAGEVHDLTAKRREAGKKGAERRWSAPKQASPSAEEQPSGMARAMASAMPNAKASAQQELWQNDGKAIAEERRGEEITTQTPSGSAESPSAPGSDKELTETQRSKRITDAYAEVEPMCKWPAVNGVVLKAIRSNRFADDEIREALLRMAREGRSVTVDALRTELQGFPARNGQPRSGERSGRRHVAYQDPPDVSVYKGSKI
jgi:hypothetical protein